jgi:hypothetical protein
LRGFFPPRKAKDDERLTPFDAGAFKRLCRLEVARFFGKAEELPLLNAGRKKDRKDKSIFKRNDYKRPV